MSIIQQPYKVAVNAEVAYCCLRAETASSHVCKCRHELDSGKREKSQEEDHKRLGV